jgi:hypothetical protein
MKLAFGGVITFILLLFIVSACDANTTSEVVTTTVAPAVLTATSTVTNFKPTITPSSSPILTNTPVPPTATTPNPAETRIPTVTPISGSGGGVIAFTS